MGKTVNRKYLFPLQKKLIVGLYTANGFCKESHRSVGGISMREGSAPGENQRERASLHVLITWYCVRRLPERMGIPPTLLVLSLIPFAVYSPTN